MFGRGNELPCKRPTRVAAAARKSYQTIPLDVAFILDTTARDIGRALNASRASVRLGSSASVEAQPLGIGEPPSPTPEDPVP